MSRIAWIELMQAGMSGLGLRPDEFWNLTPAEFLLMRGAAGGASATLTRDALAALRADYPDSENGASDDAAN